jgi:hypothetical protein
MSCRGGGLVPASAKLATLGTFAARRTVNTRGDVTTGSLTERSLWSNTLFSKRPWSAQLRDDGHAARR